MRSHALAIALAGGCALLLAALSAGGAVADVFEPIQLVSTRKIKVNGSQLIEQAEHAEESVISANGRYVAFFGSFGGVQGLWRRDIETGEVEEVAPGRAIEPSISKNGQYVSFTSQERLNPEDDHNNTENVYVRNMGTPCQGGPDRCEACPEHQGQAEPERCPFTLVSAVNGSEEGPEYSHGETTDAGSFASGRTAMSENGNEVVFETEAESNLLGVPTPAREILLRNIEKKATTLVSSEYDPQTGTDTGVPVPLIGEGETAIGAAHRVEQNVSGLIGGASISADGDVVSWLGQEIGRQARLLPREQTTYPIKYNEPLWREVGEGGDAKPSAPTLRVTGGSEPENAACAASGEQELPVAPSPLDPCQGPFGLAYQLSLESELDYLLDVANNIESVPQLSASGNEVAFLASAYRPGIVEFRDAEDSDDVYVAEMGSDAPHHGLRRLTEIAGESAKEEYGHIVDLAISPEGNEVAFSTVRTQFPLPEITLVSPVLPKTGIKELYDVDLDNDTLTRVTHGYLGESVPSEWGGERESEEAGATSPSFSEYGNTLSFTSDAYDLVYGDGNNNYDAFVVERKTLTGESPQQEVSSPPPPPALIPPWRIYARATSERNGTVLVDVEVPAGGELSASATSSVPVTVPASKAARRRAHGAARKQTVLQPRTVANAAAVVPADTDGLEQLTLSLASPYRALAERSVGLYANLALRFTAPGQPTLRATLGASFDRVAVRHKTTSSRSAHGASRRKDGHR